jgi:hypothetical protein
LTSGFPRNYGGYYRAVISLAGSVPFYCEIPIVARP